MTVDVPAYPADERDAARGGPLAAGLPRRRPGAPARGGLGPAPRGRPLARRVQRRGHRAPRHDRDRAAGRAHPGRHLGTLGPDRQRGRHLQGRRHARRALCGQGRDPRHGGHRLLPHRRALDALLVRAPRAARLPARSATTTARGPSGARSSTCPSRRARPPSPGPAGPQRAGRHTPRRGAGRWAPGRAPSGC